MSLFKYSVVILFSLVLFGQIQAAGFTGRECLDSRFQTKVRHKGQPFGLAENILGVEKENCLIKISHEKMRFLKESWEVDVCRGPIHIKSGTGAVNVVRRSGECSRTDDSAYCQELRSLESVLQNDGLIFAEGAKENLDEPHGMIHCSYLLLQKYLREGVILSAEAGSQIVDLGGGFFEEEKPREGPSMSAPAETPVSEEAQKLFPETEELGDF